MVLCSPIRGANRTGKTGLIRVMTRTDRELIPRFLNTADDDLLSWAQALASWAHTFQRSLFVKHFFIGQHDEAEQMLGRIENSGLISQGIPSGGRSGRETGNLRHKTTHLGGDPAVSRTNSGFITPTVTRTFGAFVNSTFDERRVAERAVESLAPLGSPFDGFL